MNPFPTLLIVLVLLAGPCATRAEEDERKIAFNTHCRTCHSFRKDDNRLGPSMFGIYGAKAGQAQGYNGYSGSLVGITWGEKTLDRFIANPSAIATNTNMIYPPVADAGERKKIIEFLKVLSPP